MSKILISVASFLFVALISSTFASNTLFPIDTTKFEEPCHKKSACGYQFWRLFKVNEEAFGGRKKALDALPRSGEFVNCRWKDKLGIIRENEKELDLVIPKNRSKTEITWKADGYNQEAVEKRFIKSNTNGEIPIPENLEDGLYYFCVQNWDDLGEPNSINPKLNPEGDPELYVFFPFVYENPKPNLPDNLFMGVSEENNNAMVVKDGITYFNTSDIVLGGRFTIGEKPTDPEPEKCSFLEQSLSNFRFGMKTCSVDGEEGFQQCITKQGQRVWSKCEPSE